jgi:hypothetical protein
MRKKELSSAIGMMEQWNDGIMGSGIIPCGFSTSMAAKNDIFPTSCRNSETSN